MALTKYIPTLSDSGNYPAGAESWQSTPKRVALSAGERARKGRTARTPRAAL